MNVPAFQSIPSSEMSVQIAADGLAHLMPLHVLLDSQGGITGLGPTLRKLMKGYERGLSLLEVFRVRRPANVTRFEQLAASAGRKLQLVLDGQTPMTMKGILVPLDRQGGYLLNLSFGISVIEAVSTHHLTVSDFAPTDLAVEMLYLVEAKTAVLSESRALNDRLQVARIAAEEQAFTDTLTGLKNRRALDHVLPRMAEQKPPFAVMQMDLDYFKAVNDQHGHAAGDHVLKEIARILIDETRSHDVVARVGGDEFILLLPGADSRERARQVAARLLTRLAAPIPYEGVLCRIGGSMGAALSTDYVRPDPVEMLRDADEALYRSKEAGRGRLTISGGPVEQVDQLPKPHSPPREAEF